MRNVIVLLVFLSMTTVVVVLSWTVNKDSGVIHWNMPMAYPQSNYQTKNAMWFADQIRACSEGELDIKVHGGGSLFKGNEIKRAVQTRQVPIGERVLSVHANDNALFAFDSIPFIASSFDESQRLWESSRAVLEELLDEEGIVLLYSVAWPPQGIYFRDAIENKADMKSKKFRSYNAATARLAQLAGMVSVQIEAAELSQAMAVGVVETFIASGSSGYDGKVWEHLNYYYDLQAWLPRSYVFANKQAFNSLSKRNQTCLLTNADLAASRGLERSIEITQWYKDQLKENGMTVLPPGPELRADLMEIGKIMTAEWVEAAGPKGKALLEAFNNNK